MRKELFVSAFVIAASSCMSVASAADAPKPYGPPCTERENVFAFTQKPKVTLVAKDRYEITFAVKGSCDVTVGVVDEKGVVVRHLASGVLGSNAPAPFQKDSLSQKIYWNGKDDLDRYPKDPGALSLRVMLGLKPVFDKRLGGKSPRNLPGSVAGIAVGPDGAYVIAKAPSAFGHSTIRRFDRDGKYLGTIAPPPAGLPESKLGGMGYVEYEPGKRGLQGPDLTAAISLNAGHMPPLDGDHVIDCQPVVVGDKLVFTNAGWVYGLTGSFLHWIHTDGSADAKGVGGPVLMKQAVTHRRPRLAASPDGKTLYFGNFRAGSVSYGGEGNPATAVYVGPSDGSEPAKLFAGEPTKPGSDDAHFMDVQGIDCDAKGRVYVTDGNNNRIQVLSPEGKYLKTIKIRSPSLIAVHRKTGAIYVMHSASEKGQSVPRVTKLTSFDQPQEEFHTDGFMGMMALDSWSPQPRLWFSHRRAVQAGWEKRWTNTGSVTIWEEREGKLEKMADFDDDARKEAGKSWWGRWSSIGSLANSRTVCDPTREKLYYGNAHLFDLSSGTYEGRVQTFPANDIAFCKRGYMHGHKQPSFPCVWRADPAQAAKGQVRTGSGELVDSVSYTECPYNYGEQLPNNDRMIGVIRTKCQPGPHGFQMGIGVNMRGDIAIVSQIYYVPKMEDVGMALAMMGPKSQSAGGRWCEEGFDLDRLLKESARRGETVYAVPRRPGIPLAGSTIWTFDAQGELKNSGDANRKLPVVNGRLVNGVQLDEDGFVYFAMRHMRQAGGKVFLEGAAGILGGERKTTPPVWVYVKGHPEKLKVSLQKAIVPMDQPPKRPFDLADPNAWIKGAEWLYAGASPVVNAGCICPQSRFHLDWYKRSYVTEIYRHSVAILDTGGNLIMHLGRYANFDSAPGGKDGCKPGETDIGMTGVRFIGGTDNYLGFEDWGERFVVLKLAYHAEETVPIGRE